MLVFIFCVSFPFPNSVFLLIFNLYFSYYQCATFMYIHRLSKSFYTPIFFYTLTPTPLKSFHTIIPASEFTSHVFYYSPWFGFLCDSLPSCWPLFTPIKHRNLKLQTQKTGVEDLISSFSGIILFHFYNKDDIE